MSNDSTPANAGPFGNRNVSDDPETDLWSGGYSGKAMIGSWMGAGVLTIGLLIACVFAIPFWPVFLGVILVVWLVLGFTFAYRKLNISYQLSTQRFMHRTGILSQRTDRIEVIDIDDVTFSQTLVQRMFNVGTIHLSSSDRTHPQLVLSGIDNVKTVADLIDDTRRKERRRRGIHIESI